MQNSGTYGSLSEESLLRAASGQRSLRAGRNLEFEGGPCVVSVEHGSGDAASRPSSLSRGLSSWRAVIIAAAAATAVFATVGFVNLTSRNGNSQLPSDVSSPQLEEGPLTGTQQANLAQSRYHSAPERVQSETKGSDLWDTSPALSFKAWNEYTRRGDVIGVGYPWLQGRILVEPHRETSLEVVDPVDGMLYVWKIVYKTEPDLVVGVYEGRQIEVVFNLAPEYTVELSEKKWDGTISRKTEVDIFCKYVRREIRTLTDEERNEMFDAMKVLWDVPLYEGREIYGDRYIDLWTIDEFHQVGASDGVCDHYHDGIGFGVTHTLITLMFEQSLQLVNPKLTLPYWDYTIDGYLVNQLYDDDYTHLTDVSDMFTPEWFGRTDPETFQVRDGRWGNVTIPTVEPAAREALATDVYGRLRSPWNVNDRPYITRGMGQECGLDFWSSYSWPTCETHYKQIMMYNSYYSYTWRSQYAPHATVHLWLGGIMDCEDSIAELEAIAGPGVNTNIASLVFIKRKLMFREGFFSCSTSVPHDMSAKEILETGECGCRGFDLDKPEDYLRIFDYYSEDFILPVMTDAQKRDMAILACQGILTLGESTQSSSTMDPTFWSLHPTLERLLMFKRMSGTMTDLSWPDEPGTWVGDDGSVYDVVISSGADECFGHRGSDVFPYGIMSEVVTPQFTFWGKTETNKITNREMVHLFDPRVNALSFIYDNFEWNHCTDLGWDMYDLMDEDAATRRTARSKGNSKSKKPADADMEAPVNGFGLFKKDAPRMPLYRGHPNAGQSA